MITTIKVFFLMAGYYNFTTIKVKQVNLTGNITLVSSLTSNRVIHYTLNLSFSSNSELLYSLFFLFDLRLTLFAISLD